MCMRTFRLSFLQTLAITFVTVFVACTPGDILDILDDEDPQNEQPGNINSDTGDNSPAAGCADF